MKRTEFIEKMGGIDPKFVSEAANYRPKRMVGIRVIAIAACLAIMLTTVTVWGLSLQTEEKSSFDTICELAETKDGIFSIEKLDQKEIFSNISAENLEQIFAAFDVIIDKNDTIELSDKVSMYVNYEDFNKTADGKCTVSTTGDRNRIKLAMLMSVYFTNFPNAIASCYLDIDPDTINVVGIPFVYISFDYADYGFDNALDYLVSCHEKTSEYGDKTFVLNAYDCDMFLCKDGFDTSTPAPNLLGFARDGLSSREELFAGVPAEKTE